MNIRPATVADVPSMMNLERQCATAAHWSQGQYTQLFQHGGAGVRLILVVDGGAPVSLFPRPDPDTATSLLGFLVARHLAPEWELENIVVAASARQMGFGEHLLDALLTKAWETNSDSVFLEVRESNTAARTLYEKAEFQVCGRRKSYYTNPIEDAVLYRRSLI